jgi:hypothetical protein
MGLRRAAAATRRATTFTTAVILGLLATTPSNVVAVPWDGPASTHDVKDTRAYATQTVGFTPKPTQAPTHPFIGAVDSNQLFARNDVPVPGICGFLGGNTGEFF